MEDCCVKIQLGFDRFNQSFWLAKAVTFTWKKEIGCGDVALLQCVKHLFRLRGMHNVILRTLEKKHWARKAFAVAKGGAFLVELFARRIGSDERVCVVFFEKVCLCSEFFQIADAIKACPRCEKSVKRKGR